MPLRHVAIRSLVDRFALTLVLALSLPAHGQESADRNPHTTAEDVAAGARMFRSHCAECHGLDAAGGRGPNLTSGQFRHGNTDPDLFRVIAGGIQGSEMPGIYFQGRQIWQLVAYVRSLSEGSRPVALSGDPQRGRTLFEGRGGCLQCHRVNGQGGRLGPDLSDIGGQRSPAHLKTSLLQPNQSLSPRFWTIRARTKNDKEISGLRLNEDTHSIQILDKKENLVSLRKSDLESWRIDKQSSMPSYKDTLSPKEIDDLVAYLHRLRRKEAAP